MYPNKIMWATIFTRSVKNSASWFEKALGFKPGFIDPGENWAEIKAPEASNIAFHVSKKNGEEGSEVPEGTIQLTLTVKDLKNYHDFVKDVEGIKILRPPTKEEWGGFVAVYQAPDGARFSVLEDHFSECENKDKPKEAEKEAGGGFCHLEIFADDMGRARKFYSDVFGFTFDTWRDDYNCWKSSDPKNTLAGGLAKRTAPDQIFTHPFLHLHALGGDINGTLEKIEAAGGKIVQPKYEIAPGIGFNAFFSDTEGNSLSLYARN